MDRAEYVTIYTDGACIGNPGPGGYGVVLLKDGQRSELAGGYHRTTNNRMEIIAAIAGLEVLEGRHQIILHSDSAYLVNAMNRGWAQRWRANGWRRNKTEKALNPDLWQRLLALCELHQVKFRWVKGHSGDRENERCDRLAGQAARGQGLSVDEGYISASGSQ
jgi:ribonuclease HI